MDKNETVSVGNAIVYQKHLYYVYKINDGILDCYRITGYYYVQKENKVNVEDRSYSAIWHNNMKININDDYRIVAKASNEQIEQFEKKKTKHFKNISRGLEAGNTIGKNWIVRENIKGSDSRYLVIERIGNKLVLIRIFSLLEKDYSQMFVDDISKYLPLYKTTVEDRDRFFHVTDTRLRGSIMDVKTFKKCKTFNIFVAKNDQK